MNVLDLGSGAGDAALVTADVVGHSGSVLGVDLSPEAVDLANARAADRGLANVRFIVGDISDPAPGGPFDAVLGRLVLMYVADPAAVLRAQLSRLHSGGLVAPIEFDVSTARAIPSTALSERCNEWVRATFDSAGIEASLGPRLWSVLLEAGVRPLGMLGVQPLFGPDDPSGPALLAGITQTILPLMERFKVTTAEEVQPETLQARLSSEFAASNAVFAHPTLFCAWAKKN